MRYFLIKISFNAIIGSYIVVCNVCSLCEEKNTYGMCMYTKATHSVLFICYMSAGFSFACVRLRLPERLFARLLAVARATPQNEMNCFKCAEFPRFDRTASVWLCCHSNGPPTGGGGTDRRQQPTPPTEKHPLSASHSVTLCARPVCLSRL